MPSIARSVWVLAIAVAALLAARPALAQGTDVLISLHNQKRAAQGLAPLTRSRELEQAALKHAADMARGPFMSHTGSDGSNPHERIRAAGYGGGYTGENVGSASASHARYLWTHSDMVKWWMNSPPHRANILKKEYTQIGVAHVTVRAGSKVSSYWCVTFGGP